MDSPPNDLTGRRWSTRWAQVLLVLLRVAVGWHLLVQGWEKIQSVNVGPTETKQPWSSRGFLLESQGPFAPWFRKLAGDSDALVHDYLRLPQSRDLLPDELSMPQKVEALWDERLKQVLERNHIGKAHRPLFEALAKAQKRAFQQSPRPLPIAFPAGTVTAPLSLSGQIAYFQKKRQELRSLLEQEQPALGADVRAKQAAELKAETARLQPALLKHIAEVTAAFDQALDAALAATRPDDAPAEALAALAQPQGQIGPLAAALVQAGWAGASALRTAADLPPLEASIPLAAPPSDLLAAADFSMRWGLFVSGILLIVGLGTRFACVAGCLLLLLIFAAHPPLPGLPDPARLAPGYTPYVNQTLIEALALLALAGTRSGAWLGLDALWRFIPGKKRKAEPAAPAPPAAPWTTEKTTGTGKHKRYTGA